jgi:hypothetical protein
MDVGMPAALYLQEFGSQVWAAFGEPPYHVGSSLQGKQWRDVDVRLILPDEQYVAMFGEPDDLSQLRCGKWVAMCMAFSALGKQMTGLPIDFQIQQQTRANKTFDGPRSALGFLALRTGKETNNGKASIQPRRNSKRQRASGKRKKVSRAND